MNKHDYLPVVYFDYSGCVFSWILLQHPTLEGVARDNSYDEDVLRVVRYWFPNFVLVYLHGMLQINNIVQRVNVSSYNIYSQNEINMTNLQ